MPKTFPTAWKKNIPYLEKAYISSSPKKKKDSISVGELGVDGGNKELILKFAREVADSKHDNMDSLLISYKGKLLFESYYKRGRANYPHYQMSITKSYTAMALGRAIQLEYLTTADLDKPVVSFLKNIDQSKLVDGADTITLAQAMNMGSGIRIDRGKVRELMKETGKLKGQGQIQAYLTHSAPITTESKAFKYQSSDPSITMQVIEAVVPGSAEDFIKTEVLGKMGITNYGWQDDISGLPKSAAGSSMRSRDMLKWGLLTMNGGKWQGEQLIPEKYVAKAIDRIHTNQSKTSYGFFWWRADMQVGDTQYDCISGRGAGGQFILMLPELELIVVVTSHNKGMGKTLATVPKRILPAFIKK